MRNNQKGFASILVVIIAVIVLGVVVFAGFKVFKKNDTHAVATEKTAKIASQNKTNASSLQTETDQQPAVIDGDKAAQISSDNPSGANSTSQSTPQPTIFPDGPSTKLDRADVHGVNLALYGIYSKYLFALNSATQDQRQAVSNQYLADNKSYLSDAFYNANANSTNNLSLLLQSPDLSLPTSLRIGSAIVDPNDPTKVIAQVLMEPDVPWSILVSVKMKDSLGNFGTIEQVYVRQNRNPL